MLVPDGKRTAERCAMQPEKRDCLKDVWACSVREPGSRRLASHKLAWTEGLVPLLRLLGEEKPEGMARLEAKG